MPTSATGSAEPPFRPAPAGSAGFTLVELLVVLVLLGLLSAAVVVAMPDPRGSLVAEAERFAARAKAAQDLAVIEARATAIRITPAGYGFDRREGAGWVPLARRPFDDQAWGEDIVARVAPASERVTFDPTGLADPLDLRLGRDGEEVTVTIAGDGRIDVAR